MTLEAFEVCIDSHSVFFLVFVIWRGRIFEDFVFVGFLVDQPLHGLLLDLGLEPFESEEEFCEWRLFGKLEPLVAEWALAETKADACCLPFQL